MKYLCFDSALNEVYTLLQLQKEYTVYFNLFKGTADEYIWDVAPWLFQIDNDYIYKDRQDPNYSLKRCLIIETPTAIRELTVHLQQFIYTKINAVKQFNRFWDAAVLPELLKRFDTKQLVLFFEEIAAIYVQDGDDFLQYSCDQKDRLAIKKILKKDLFTIPTEDYMSNHNKLDKSVENKPKTRRFFTD